MKGILKILFVEDNKNDAELIWHEIKRHKIAFTKLLIDNRNDFFEALKSFNPDLIISDYSLPEFDGMKALLLRNEIAPLVPFILVTGSINEEVAVECMKAGADDYILKDNLSRLGSSIINSVNKGELLKQKTEAEAALLESEERFRILYNDAVVGLYRTNLKGEIFLANKTLVKMLGFKSFEELSARNLTEAGYGSSYRREVFIDQIEKEGEVKDLEAIWICRDGKEIFVRESAKAFYDSDGKILYYDGTVQDITEQKHAAAALNKIQHLFETLALVSPVGIFRTDQDGRTTYVNPKWMELSGLNSDEAIGFGWLKAVHPEDREQLEKRWKSDIKSQVSSSSEYRFLRADGSIIWVMGTAVPEMNDDENGGYIGTITDISDRKLVEDELMISLSLTEATLESIHNGILVISSGGSVIKANARFAEMWHIPDDILASGEDKTLLDFVLKQLSDPDEFIAKVNDLYEKPGAESYDLIYFNDGRIFERISKPMFLGSQPKGRVWSFHDITESKRAEEAISMERSMLRTLIDNLPDPIYVLDNNCRKLIANKADVNNIGQISEEEVLGKSDIELFPGQVGVRGHADNMEIINTGRAIIEREEDFIDKEGLRRWLLTTKIPLRNNQGIITGLVGIGYDITARKENEKELIRAKEKAEEGDRLKTAFLHNISHEIRTPMNAIVGFSTLLGEPDVDAETRKSYTEVIMQSSNHLLAIITDIVDISNIEADLVKVDKSEINLNSAVKILCDQFMLRAKEKSLSLSCDCGLKDAESYILMDNTKLFQVLSNLVGNAIKFTGEGGIKVKYEVENENIKFTVADTGIGIPQEHYEHVFDRFYQVEHSVSRLYEGTGLGLAISKAYVELLGGKIWLTSEPGKGTSFFFTLPYEKRMIKTVIVKEPGVMEEFIFPVTKKILVAEDIDSNFKLITYFLSRTNTNIIRAVNGKEAVDKTLADKDIDLILMDIKMPEMDGFTATRLIREKNTVVPIIAQTAYVDDRELAIDCGCSGFISKPFDRKSLLKVISEFI